MSDMRPTIILDVFIFILSLFLVWAVVMMALDMKEQRDCSPQAEQVSVQPSTHVSASGPSRASNDLLRKAVEADRSYRSK